jgi:hypothetical protein
MKTSLDHLPPRKQRQLGALVEEIRRAIEVELVILFGSHARGDWVEDPVGGYFLPAPDTPIDALARLALGGGTSASSPTRAPTPGPT